MKSGSALNQAVAFGKSAPLGVQTHQQYFVTDFIFNEVMPSKIREYVAWSLWCPGDNLIDLMPIKSRQSQVDVIPGRTVLMRTILFNAKLISPIRGVPPRIGKTMIHLLSVFLSL